MERRAQRLVILSVPFGGGHRAVADGLRDLLLADPAFRDFDVRVADALDSVTRRVPLARLGAAFYRLITMPAARWLYRLLYGLTDHCPDQVGWCCALLFQARAKRWLREANPSVIISTFPLVTYVVSAALDAGSHTSLMNVVTDGGAVNRSWFGGRADTYLVTDDEAFEAGRKRLGNDHRLIRIPLPLRAGFSAAPVREGARQVLHLGDQRVVLVWGGGRGMAKRMLAVAEEMRRQRLAVTPIFLTGGDRRLSRRLAPLTTELGGLVITQCNDVAALLSAADVVVGKAGWVSLTEAVAAGLHTVCIDAYPGQEAENLRVRVGEGWASWQPDIAAAVRAISRDRAPQRGPGLEDQRGVAAGVLRALAT
jgi:processive 1,2-diacylglycerol beta-glucosyltransferase